MSVAVNIVTYNSEQYIDSCLQSVFAQQVPNLIITVIDNGSSDSTPNRLREWAQYGVRVILQPTNLFYSKAHNLALTCGDEDYVVTLNPDVILAPGYLGHVLQAFARSPRIGSVNGKLLKIDSPEAVAPVVSLPPGRFTIDGAGLMMLRSRRPYLRGHQKLATKACTSPGYIFGADGACAAYRREMLRDLAINGECFDEDFVIYREDVDLAWRAQILGWDCYYAPSAVAFHVRGFSPGQRRRHIDPALRHHSVKNGWLLLAKNERSLGAFLRSGMATVPYQARITGGLVLTEWSSLGAIGEVRRLWPRMMLKRAIIHGRRRRPWDEIERWFGERGLAPLATDPISETAPTAAMPAPHTRAQHGPDHPTTERRGFSQ